MRICVQLLTVRLFLSALLELGQADIYAQPVNIRKVVFSIFFNQNIKKII